MAVVDRAWHGYKGELTPERWRFLVLPRFAWGDLFRSRILTAYYGLCCLVPLVFAVLIYLRYNLGALAFLGIQAENLERSLPIDGRFFALFLAVQTGMGFVFSAFIGPALVAPDLAHNALPLYFGRPFSRSEYVIGKFSSLAILLSAITWVPGLLLFGLQSFMAGAGWGIANLRFAGAMLAGGLLWVLVTSLLALAISAWIRWRPVATALLFGISAVGAGIGAAVWGIFRTSWGFLLSPGMLLRIVGADLFGVPLPERLPVWAAWMGLLGFATISLILLSRRVRATEVVR
ncbi:MAG: hypothetical protein ABI609_12140 [Acidobacteriota bacterium]